MVRHLVRVSLSTLLILLTLPFLAISFLVAAVCAAAASALPRFQHEHAARKIGPVELQPVDQFGFQNAIGAYENLIGAHAWKKS